MPINENTLEQVIITELRKNGYEYFYGPDINRDYHEVILRDSFEAAMFIRSTLYIQAEARGKPQAFCQFLVRAC